MRQEEAPDLTRQKHRGANVGLAGRVAAGGAEPEPDAEGIVLDMKNIGPLIAHGGLLRQDEFIGLFVHLVRLRSCGLVTFCRSRIFRHRSFSHLSRAVTARDPALHHYHCVT